MEAGIVDDSFDSIPGGSGGIGIGSAAAIGEINGSTIVKNLIVGDVINKAIVIGISDGLPDYTIVIDVPEG